MQMDEPTSIPDIRRAEAEIEKHTLEILGSLFELLDRELEVLVAGLALARESRSQERDGGFMFMFIALGTKVLSVTLSAGSLVKKGRYGDALILFRTGISATNTLQFVEAYDEHVADWMASDGQDLPSEEKKRIYRIFEDKNMRAKLMTKDINPMTKAYWAISDSVHSSLVGVQMYARESYGKPSTHYLELLPTYDALRAAGVVSSLIGLLSVVLDVIWNRYLDAIGDTDDWQVSAEKWAPLRPKVLAMSTKLSDGVEEMTQALRDGSF